MLARQKGNPLEFGLYCVIDSAAVGSVFTDFIFVHKQGKAPCTRCCSVSGGFPDRKLQVHARTDYEGLAKAKRFGFSVVDKQINPEVRLRRLVIEPKQDSGGIWLFTKSNGDPDTPLEFNDHGGVNKFEECNNPNILPYEFRIYDAIDTHLTLDLDNFVGQVMRFKVTAVIEVGGNPKTYVADPVIEPDPGGDA